MPNNKSTAKRLRSDAKRTSLNRWRKRAVKDTEHQFLACVESNDGDGAKEALTKCYAALDKAAKNNTIHANKASRKKTRLSARLKAM